MILGSAARLATNILSAIMLGVLARKGGQRAVVIVAGVHTKDAIKFADGQPIELIDGTRLIERILGYKAHAPRGKETVAVQPQPPKEAPTGTTPITRKTVSV
ncbi:MAG: hypothetical protein ACI9ZV_000748 [Candidatus Azotimanducaceae bacterium]|jgi:hypothetical protein